MPNGQRIDTLDSNVIVEVYIDEKLQLITTQRHTTDGDIQTHSTKIVK